MFWVWGKTIDPWKDAPPWALEMRHKLNHIIWQNEALMSTFDELKAKLDATVALVGKVRADVVSLHAAIDAIPPAGMTPEQQTALDAAVVQASDIVDALGSVDALTADAPPVVTESPAV